MRKHNPFLILSIDEIELIDHVKQLIVSKGLEAYTFEDLVQNRQRNDSFMASRSSFTLRLQTIIHKPIEFLHLLKNFFALRFVRNANLENIFIARFIRFLNSEKADQLSFSNEKNLLHWSEPGKLTIDLDIFEHLKLRTLRTISLVIVGTNLNARIKSLVTKGQFTSIFFIDYNQISLLHLTSEATINLTSNKSTISISSKKMNSLPLDKSKFEINLSKIPTEESVLFIVDELPTVDYRNIYFQFWNELIRFRNFQHVSFLSIDDNSLMACLVDYDFDAEQFMEPRSFFKADLVPLINVLSPFQLVCDTTKSNLFPFERVSPLIHIEYYRLNTDLVSPVMQEWLLQISVLLICSRFSRIDALVDRDLPLALNWSNWAREICTFLDQEVNQK